MVYPARTITVVLDMNKAFHTINIHTLIRRLIHTKIPGTIIKFIANYIKGLKAYTTFAWTKQNNFTLNPNTTTCTRFTPDSAEYKSNIYLTINNTTLPIATHPKLLGLTSDQNLTYSIYIQNISVQTHTPLQTIKHSQQLDGINRRRHPMLPFRQP